MDTYISNIGQLVSPVSDGLNTTATPCSVNITRNTQLMIQNGRFVDPSTHVLDKSHHAIDANGGVVMPGLVDPFWVLPSVPQWVREASETSSLGDMDQLGWGQRLLHQSLRSGVTTIEAKCSHDSTLQGLSALGYLEQQQRPRVLGALLAALPDDAADRERRVSSLIGEVIPEIRHRRLATFCDIGWGSHASVASDVKAVLRAAIGAGLRPKLHVVTTPQPRDVVEMAVSLEVAAVACASHFPTESTTQLGAGHVVPVYLPNLYRGHASDGFCVRSLLDQGLSVAVGSGNGLTNTHPTSMWSVLKSAMDRMGMSLLEAIWTCTLGNARAMELAHEIGSLEVGHRADLILLDVADYRELSTMQGHPTVSMVMVNGEIACQA